MKRKCMVIVSVIILGVSLFTGYIKMQNEESTNQDKSLIGAWNFNEEYGEEILNSITAQTSTVHYVYNRKNAGALYKEPSDPLWNVKGVKQGCLLFDGYSTYIEEEGFEMPSEAVTISLWVAPRAFEWGDEGKLSSFVSQGDKGKEAGIQFGMYRHGSWSLQLGVGNDESSEWIEIWDNDHPLPKNKWSYIVATYDTKVAKASLYMNGELINEMEYSDCIEKGILPCDNVFTIGKTTNNVRLGSIFDLNMYNGLMDELEIYNYSLNEEEIRDKYTKVVTSNENGIPNIDEKDIALDPSLLATDRYRPQYHAMPGGYWMNEPHAPFYYNGKYHLFYQHNPFGPFWHQIHWGHWVSDDMVNWENVQVALSPTKGDITPDGVWSGSACYDKEGVPVLFFTAGNDSKSPNQSVGMARPKNPNDPYLLEWEIYNSIIVEQQEGQGDFGEFRDPFVWWDEQSNQYYMLVGSGTNTAKGGTALAYSSTDLLTWDFHGNFYESDYSQYTMLGEHWELPLVLPVTSIDGKIKKDIFLISPHGAGADVEVYYWLGEFDRENIRFIPEQDKPQLIDYGDGIFTGPSGMVDPVTGRTILFTIAQGKGKSSLQDYFSGWAHTAGLPISLYLNKNGQVNIKPIEETMLLRKDKLLSLNKVSLEKANKMLTNIEGDMLEIILSIENNKATEYGIKVRKGLQNEEYTTIYYSEVMKELVLDDSNSTIKGTKLGIRTAKIEKQKELINIHIFLDRSLIEIYGNNIASITSRIYPSLATSMGIELFSNGEIEINKLEIFSMNTVFTDKVKQPFYPN